MSSRFVTLRWVWDAETGETFLSTIPAAAYAVITKVTSKDNRFTLSIGSYEINEMLRPSPYQHAIEKQATARVRFHLNEYMKQERKKFAAVQRDCLDLLKRLPK